MSSERLRMRQQRRLPIFLLAVIGVAFSACSSSSVQGASATPTATRMSAPTSTPTVAQVLYATSSTSSDRYVYALDTKSGAQIAVTQLTYQHAQVPIVANGAMYFSVQEMDAPWSGHVFAVRLSDGKELWRFDTKSGSPAIAAVGDMVYVDDDEPLGSSTLYGLHAGDGSVAWQFGQWGLDSTMTLAGNTLYIGTLHEDGSRYLYAVSTSDGAQIWHYTLDGIQMGQAEQVGEMVYVATLHTIGRPGTYYPAAVFAVRASDGTLAWKSGDIDARQRPLPLAADGNVYASVKGDGDSFSLVAYDAGNGAERWRISEAASCPASLVAAGNGEMYYITCDSHLVAISSLDGTERWRIDVGRVGRRVSTAAGLYVISDGTIEALDPQSGTVLWRRAPENAGLDLTFVQS